MRREWKRQKTKVSKRKADGSSIYIYIPMVFLLICVLIHINLYLRVADTLYENYKTSIDAANLSITVSNNDALLHDGRLGIVACSTDGSTTEMNTSEETRVGKLFESYEKTLQSNIGLDNTFAFKGGTCGWAGNIVTSGTVEIDMFLIYDIAPDNTVYAYEINNVKSYQSASAIQTKIKKRVAGKVTKDAEGNVTGTTVRTPENTLVTDCTVYSKVSFPVKASDIASLNDGKMDENDADNQEYLDGKMRVSTSATTSLKTGTAFEDLDGNGWFR